ncbi:MAG: PilZ domain-containing protein [Thermoanaerobaculia bacterium]|nr:PilZ domain-containing protein [Thermoanaerobaculia bacterium]
MGEAEQLTISNELAQNLSRAPRVEHEAVVRIYCSGRRGLETGFLKNLSCRGMFLRILEPEAVGTRLHFEFRPDPKRPETVTGTAEVAFSRETYGGPGRPPGMGLRFLALTREGSEIVSRLTGDEVRVPVGPVPEMTDESSQASRPGTREGSPLSAPISSAPISSAPMMETSEEPGMPVEAVAAGAPETSILDPGPRDDRPAPATGSFPDRPSDGFWPVLVVVLVLVSGAAGFILWERQEPLVASGSAPVDEANGSTSTPTEDPRPASSRTPDGSPTARAVHDGDLQEPSSTEAPPRMPARRVKEVLWETGPSSLVIVLRGDGSFEEGQATYSHIGGDNPRGVVRIREMERASAGLRLTPESPLVNAIRTGFHADGREGRELHVVIDLADSETRITGMVASGTDLLVYLGRS